MSGFFSVFSQWMSGFFPVFSEYAFADVRRAFGKRPRERGF